MKKYKILFLDIDGVLNMYGNSYRSFKGRIDPIESIPVQRLNYMCELIEDLRIVVSSSWRYNMDRVIQYLNYAGFKYSSRILGATPGPIRKEIPEDPPYEHIQKDRGEQILKWMHDNIEIIENYVVVDDEIYDIQNYIDNTYIVEIDGAEGLLNKDVMKICKILLNNTVSTLLLDEFVKNELSTVLQFNLRIFSNYNDKHINSLVNKFIISSTFRITHNKKLRWVADELPEYVNQLQYMFRLNDEDYYYDVNSEIIYIKSDTTLYCIE